MTTILVLFERDIPLILWAAVALAVLALCAVIVERAAVGWALTRRRRLEVLYKVLLKRALDRDLGARRTLIASPSRHRLIIAALLITPLIEDRDPDRIAQTREIVEGLALVPIADRYLRSWFWWRRALALRALGLTQILAQAGLFAFNSTGRGRAADRAPPGSRRRSSRRRCPGSRRRR